MMTNASYTLKRLEEVYQLNSLSYSEDAAANFIQEMTRKLYLPGYSKTFYETVFGISLSRSELETLGYYTSHDLSDIRNSQEFIQS